MQNYLRWVHSNQIYHQKSIMFEKNSTLYFNIVQNLPEFDENTKRDIARMICVAYTFHVLGFMANTLGLRQHFQSQAS